MRYERLTLEVQRVLDEYAAFLQGALRQRRVLEVACGTGYWTERVAEAAEQVHATDVLPEMLVLARSRVYARGNVTHAQADAYLLENVEPGWNAGFHFQWLSHVPRARISDFLRAFHARLAPGAVVVCGDNLDSGTEPDEDGNLYQWRELAGEPRYRIIKNCPSEAELDALLAPWSRSIVHRRFSNDWFVRYTLDLAP
jgi:demethylmenaquinone methyltransferase/2-methoxy-6-polyprenyl-1,4-benzoquinol methylase